MWIGKDYFVSAIKINHNNCVPYSEKNPVRLSFIIWVFTAIEWNGRENSHVDIILHPFSNTSSEKNILGQNRDAACGCSQGKCQGRHSRKRYH